MIWMQHITYQMPDFVDYDEGICRIVNKNLELNYGIMIGSLMTISGTFLNMTFARIGC